MTGDPCGSSQSRDGPVPFFRKLTGDCRVNAVANSVRKDTDTACHPRFTPRDDADAGVTMCFSSREAAVRKQFARSARSP